MEAVSNWDDSKIYRTLLQGREADRAAAQAAIKASSLVKQRLAWSEAAQLQSPPRRLPCPRMPPHPRRRRL